MSNQEKIVKRKVIKKALKFADEAFSGHFRKDGRPTSKHFLDVFDIMIYSPHDFTVPELCGGILHDVTEDTPVTYDVLVVQFNEEIAILVDKMSCPDGMDMLVYYKGMKEVSPRVIAMKLCDITGNLESLGGCSDEFQERFKGKIIKVGWDLMDVLRMHGKEWREHCDWIQDRWENILGPKPEAKVSDEEYYNK